MTSPLTNSYGSRASTSQSNINPTVKSSGHKWQELTKKITKALVIAMVVIITVVSVAALIVGVVALINPAGLGLLGAGVASFLTVSLAWVVEHSIAVLICGAVGTGIILVGIAINALVKRCGLSKSTNSDQSA